MTQPVLESVSTLTDRYQTTVPETVRKALHLQKRDKIHYTVLANGDVVMSRATDDAEDPVVGSFLNFLANDIRQNPQNIQAVDSTLLNRIQSLVSDVELDLDIPLSDEDD